MNKYLIFLVLTISLVLSGSCSNQSSDITANPGDEINLGAGQTAAINGEPLKLKFIEVTSDSRCPTGVTCIWAGEVKCTLEITYKERVELQTLVQSGGSPDFAEINYKEYRIDFNVQPYPEAGKEIPKSDYLLKVKVTK
jgi:hypothetical protein